MPEVGIVMTLRDRMSSTMKSMINTGTALNKEFEELYDRVKDVENLQAGLAKGIAETKTGIAKQTDAVKAAKNAWDALRKSENASSEDLNGAADRYQDEVEKLNRLKDQLNEYTASSKDARTEMRELSSEYRKMKTAMAAGETDASGQEGAETGGFWSRLHGKLTSKLGELGETGIFKMLGDSGSQMVNSLVESAAGQPLASAISSLVSGVATGGALAGPAGAAIGALAGGIAGGTQIFEAQDEAFKSYYQDAYNTVTEEQAAALSSGSTIAGSREQTQMAFAQRFGSDEAAEEYLDRVKKMAANTNYDYDEITGYSKKLLNSYDPEAVFGVLQRLSDATAGLDLSSGDVDVLISGLSRMRTTGKATSEYLNYFRERGIDADQALADALGVDKSGISDLVTKGQIGGVEAAEALLDYIDREFGGLSDKLASTYDAMVDNLGDAEANLEAAMGEGYNETRKEGIQAQMDWLSDNEGALGDAYSMIGEWKASLENTKEQLEREAMDAVMSGVLSESYLDSNQRGRLEELAQAYQDALAEYETGNEAAGAQMGALLAEAQVIAMNEYNASDGAQLALESELALAGAIRDDASTNAAYYDAGYRKSQEFSRGLAAGLADSMGERGIQSGLMAALENGTGYSLYGYYVDADTLQGKKSNAFGLDRVPYDDYPALLHEGERVLTASEARAMDREAGGGVTYQVTVTGNSFMGTGDEMADQVAEVIVRKLEQASVAAAPR